MTGEPVFLDTFALIALAATSDAWHTRAKATESELAGAGTPLVTSDWVLAEFLDTGSSIKLRAPAARMVNRLRESSRTQIVESTRSGWLDAFELFAQRADKEWSFVDCSSVLICQSRGIRRVFSNDHHFTQAELEVLLQ